MPRPTSCARLGRIPPAVLAACAAGALATAASPAPAQTSAGTHATVDSTPPTRAARGGFADSWFWGAKGGAMRLGTTQAGRFTAPVAGVDWLVTRERAALLLGAEQAFFDRPSVVAEPGRPGVGRVVDVRDARRFSVTLLAVPTVIAGRLRPYAGLGLALEQLRTATARGEFDSPAQLGQVQDAIDGGASRASLLLVAGVQASLGRAGLFVQGSATPEQSRTLWNRGGALQLDVGVRLNLARASDL